MEEWHQKLHNNTSPDDVIICQALLAYLEHDLDIRVYWQTLQVAIEDNGYYKQATSAVTVTCRVAL